MLDIMAIPLSQGLYALVDGKNYEWLMQWKWFLHKGHSTDYARRHGIPRGKKIYMHRQIMNPPKGILIDHKNDTGLDNRESNLRECNSSQNIANSRGRKKKTSLFKGVSWNKRDCKWEAFIGYNKKKIRLGMFAQEKDAAKAYDNKAKELYGDFARKNCG